MNEFHFLSTHVGSVPHHSPDGLTDRLVKDLDIPAWPQFPHRDFRESMYVQYSSNLPSIRIDPEKEKIFFDTTGDLTPDLEKFYSDILDDNVEAFALVPEYSAGFFAMVESLQKNPGTWAKGQVTGPISFGLTVTDQDLRASLYNELLSDAIVKNAAMNARWQVKHLKRFRSQVIAFVDEPYMASFGSAFISLSREQVNSMLDEIFSAIQKEGAVSGVHCCANTDWGLLLSTRVDILNLDAFGYIEHLALYPFELKEFLDRGGAICWGIIPNNEEIRGITPEELAKRLRTGIKLIIEKAAGRGVSLKDEQFKRQSLISPACGLGSTSMDISEEVFTKLVATSEILKRG